MSFVVCLFANWKLHAICSIKCLIFVPPCFFHVLNTYFHFVFVSFIIQCDASSFSAKLQCKLKFNVIIWIQAIENGFCHLEPSVWFTIVVSHVDWMSSVVSSPKSITQSQTTADRKPNEFHLLNDLMFLFPMKCVGQCTKWKWHELWNLSLRIGCVG